ncbi:MAG TPA: nucleotidyltransferase family protein [Anaerolineae bacterium]|nr:nucleotidyltransferase family protein [Anaerolineae bacterium]
MNSIHKVAAIILAAGDSNRLGFPKQLLKWHGKTLIEFIIDKAIRTKLNPIHVVLGANYNQIVRTILRYPIRIIRNKRWQSGKASSIREGISSLPDETQAVVLFVVDQPYLNDSLINALLQIRLKTSAKIITPCVKEIQCNPVLFKRDTFEQLLMLRGDDGGKTIFKHFQVKWVNWKDNEVLVDIDAKEDLEVLIKRN